MRKIDFNRDWTVQKEGQERVEHVNLPHDAMLYEKRAKENKTASASAYFEGGKYIYKKIWDVDAQTAEQTNILEFEGVYQNARVSLNGKQIAERPYGYTNFYVDLTDLLTVGQNEIQVIADNADVPNSRWYSGSGIYRDHLISSRKESRYRYWIRNVSACALPVWRKMPRQRSRFWIKMRS